MDSYGNCRAGKAMRKFVFTDRMLSYKHIEQCEKIMSKKVIMIQEISTISR
ncbi:hypothetical protein ANAEL_02392 [Anaerolineales bacterium]|nr:hypothetical protein ANAEL_02392 [Anaerolineales bacterium]